MFPAKLGSGLSVCGGYSAVPLTSPFQKAECTFPATRSAAYIQPSSVSPLRELPLSEKNCFARHPCLLGSDCTQWLNNAKVSGLAPSIQLWRPVSAPELPRGWLSLCCDCNSPLPPSAQLCFLHSPTGFILREMANKLPVHRLPSETATQESNIDLNNCFLHNLRYFLQHSCESRCNSLPLKWFSSDFLVVPSSISHLLMAFY